MDPLCEKYPHLSPYAYCGNDPVNFVDPDGRLITINGDGTDGALELINQFWGKKVTFSIDEESGNISYTINLKKKGKPYKLNKQLRYLLGIIDDQSITVNLQATSFEYLNLDNSIVPFFGGIFGGNIISDNGHVKATQFINPEDLKKIGDYTGTDPIVHEITEAYGGALISRKKGVGSPDSSHKIHSVYDQAHAEAMYPQKFILSRKMYDSEGLRVDNIADAAIIKYIVKKRNKEQKTIRVAKFIK